MASKTEERLPPGWKLQFKVQKTGRKMKYYMNCSTGQKFFSKEDLLRYVKMERTQLLKLQSTNGHGKRNSENKSMKLVDKENLSEPTNGHGKRLLENNSMKHVAEENDRPEWLPDGWVVDLKARKSGSTIGKQYKVYTDPLTGCKFFSKPEVLRYLESVKHKNLPSERKTTRISASPTSKVVVEKSTVDDLPSGWIKETKIKKTANGIRKDPYYTDPVSGYVFRSKKDVFRYLETGVISKYAIKPTKGSSHGPGLINDEASPLPAAKRQKSEHPTRRRLFSVKESSHVLSPADDEAEVLKKRRGKGVSSENGLAGVPMVEQMAEIGIKEGAEARVIPSLSSSAWPKFKGSKRNQGKKVFADNCSVSSPAIDILRGERFLESCIECSNRESLNGSTKSEKKKMLNLPRRSSKRLAGREPELVANLMSIEHACNNVTTESCKSKATPVACLTACDLVGEVSQQLKVGSGMELANCVSSVVNIPSSAEPSNTIKSSRDQAIPGEQMQKLKYTEINGDISEQHASLYFGDSYLDPCLESAFKALMGEKPANSNPDNGPVLTRAADILLENNLQETKMEKSWNKHAQVNPKKSKNKQEFNLPRRSSKRLAGHEPEIVASWLSIEQAPRNGTIKSRKSKDILTAGLTSSCLVDEGSQQLKARPEMGLASCLSSEVNIPSNGDTPSKIKSLENPAIRGKQSAETNDDNSEPHVSLSLGGSYLDPCKALMGEIAVDCRPDNGPLSTTAADVLQENNLLGSKVEKNSNKRTQVNSAKSKNRKELNLLRRSSKRLAGIEPDLATNSISVEQGCANATIEDLGSKALANAGTDPQGLAECASQQPEAGHETIDAQHDCTDKGTPLHEELSSKSSKPHEAETVPEEQFQKLENKKPEEQSQKLENERMDQENPDSQLLFPFGDSWSDPCLEFAFKTLTGAIPVDDNLEIQDYFRHQVDPSDTHKEVSSVPPGFCSVNNSSVLPGFGSVNDSSVLPGFGSIKDSSVSLGFGSIKDSSVPLGFGSIKDSSVSLGFGSIKDSSVPLGFGSINDSSVLPGFGSVNSVSPEKQPVSQQQLPTNPSPSSGSVRIPSCNSIASQEPKLSKGMKNFMERLGHN